MVLCIPKHARRSKGTNCLIPPGVQYSPVVPMVRINPTKPHMRAVGEGHLHESWTHRVSRFFYESLSRVCQTGKVYEYQTQLERLANHVNEWSQKALVGCFIGGLKDEITLDVKMFFLMCTAVGLAHLQKEELQWASPSAIDSMIGRVNPSNHAVLNDLL